jgi:hypothetical protein
VTLTTADRIAGRMYKGWDTAESPMPKQAIVVSGPRGIVGDPGAGLLTVRFDFACYGSVGHEATLLWRVLNYHLCPPQGSGRKRGFRYVNTAVLDVQLEGGPTALIDREGGGLRTGTEWPFTHASYLFTYHGEPIQ